MTEFEIKVLARLDALEKQYAALLEECSSLADEIEFLRDPPPAEDLGIETNEGE